MSNEWEEVGDYLEGHAQARRLPGPLLTAESTAVAALVLTAVSLFIVGAGDSIAESSSFGFNSSTKVLAVIPGIQALVAVIGVVLARVGLRLEDGSSSWARHLAAAALFVGAVSLVVNLTAFGYALA